jgi:NAD(P)-dependent dehydrogenase (short-subunit alcohol dehydrogenase family)
MVRHIKGIWPPGMRALGTGRDSGKGRAAAMAYAGEGADVAINYLPDEEPDAREVIVPTEEEGRKGVALPGDLRNEGFLRKACRGRAQGWLTESSEAKLLLDSYA